jgi:hypothetical protein
MCCKIHLQVLGPTILTSKLQEHPLSSVCDCLFAVTNRIEAMSSRSVTLPNSLAFHCIIVAFSHLTLKSTWSRQSLVTSICTSRTQRARIHTPQHKRYMFITRTGAVSHGLPLFSVGWTLYSRVVSQLCSSARSWDGSTMFQRARDVKRWQRENLRWGKILWTVLLLGFVSVVQITNLGSQTTS